MQFAHQVLTWGFLIALAPLLIHLINMMRHRRVRWAAMEFLLQSYKKHRKWIWLKQLLLLLMRMAAIAMIVAMLAQWISRKQWSSWFEGETTHHYLVLDDSYSMSERVRGLTAFDQAKQVIGKLASKATAESKGNPQKLTLLRGSLVSDREVAENEGRLTEIADFNATLLDGRFDLALEERRRTMDATQLAVGLRGALELVNQLIRRDEEEAAQVYLLSDFRARDWEKPVEVKDLLLEMQQAGAKIHFVDCAAAEPNLGITKMEVSDDTHAAGVPFFVNVTVKNYGAEAVRDVQVKLRSLFYDQDKVADSRPDTLEGQVEDLPLDQIEKLAAGQSVTRRVQVYYPKPGRHVVEASLPDDAVDADNRRWCVVDCPEGEAVLVIDGSVNQKEAYYLTAAFAPGSRANTGVRPVVETVNYLDDAAPERMAEFTAVYLLDVPRLNENGLRNLERYVKAGGGLCVFGGPDLNLEYYTEQLYQNGQGLLPIPLAGDDLLPSEVVENNPDIRLENHPIFQAMLGERNPLIRMVTVERFLKAPDGWSPPGESTVNVIATLRNQRPLVVEKQYGEGRVVTVLTSLSPDWNNWALNPSFVVALLRIQSYLAAGRRVEDVRRVGAALEIQLEVARFRKDLVFVTPGSSSNQRVPIETSAVRKSESSPLMSAAIGGRPRSRVQIGETDRSGVYEVWPMANDGEIAVQRWAVNVNETEGDLAIVQRDKLLKELEPVEVKIRHVDEFQYDLGEQRGFNRSLLLMCLLIPLLIGEQILGYFASYHPPRGSIS